MRLGEIRNILRGVLTDDNQISIAVEAIFGGQAQIVKNYGALISALDVLATQGWNELDYSEIEAIKTEYGSEISSIQLPQEKFNQLNAYVASANAKVPLYVSILETMVEDQDEKVINIQLPAGVESLKDLSDVNKRLEEILKFFNIDGEFQFQGFDKGSDWYMVIAVGILSHQYLIACLQVAQEYLKLQAEYFKSQEAQISYESTLKEKEENPGENYEKYQEKWLKLFIEKKVKEAIKEIKEMNGKTQSELETQLVRATTSLVKELKGGTEFHLSLNPPNYANEQRGKLEIDYKRIQSLNSKKEEGVKQLQGKEEQEIKEIAEKTEEEEKK